MLKGLFNSKPKENNSRSITHKNMSWHFEKEGVQVAISAADVGVEDVGDTQEILDKSVWDSRIRNIGMAILESVKHDKSKYCPLPKSVEVIFHNKDLVSHKVDEVAAVEKADLKEQVGSTKNEFQSIVVRNPRWSFDDVYVDAECQQMIDRTLLIAKHRKKLFDEWKLGNGVGEGRAIVFNFFGPPGTGKSMTGEAIANQLGRKVYAVNYSDLESKYVGETPKNITAVFKCAKQDNAVLIFDEADSFLGKRLTNVSQAADYGVNITRSVMLLELEQFDGIVIFTTNLIKNYDEAFKRRILASIEFKLPNEEGRRRIWNLYLNRDLPIGNGVTANLLAEKYSEISGADIKDITLYAATSALCRDENEPCLNVNDFDSAYKIISQRHIKGNVEIIHETITEEQYKKEVGQI